MNWQFIVILVAAVVPGIVLGGYVWKKDRADKEPFGLLALLFVLGAAVGPVAGTFNGLSSRLIDSLFSDDTYIYYIISFLAVGIVEEGLKFLVLYLVTHKNKNFNSLFDGIIYSVFVSLGFAVEENILCYVLPEYFEIGFTGALEISALRAFLSVPFHTFFAINMGVYYSQWKVHKTAAQYQLISGIKIGMTQQEAQAQMAKAQQNPIQYKKYLAYAFISPVIFHGLYDTLCTFQALSNGFFIAFLVLIIVGYVRAFGSVKKYSESDASIFKHAALAVREHEKSTASN